MVKNRKITNFFYFLLIAFIFLIVLSNPISGEEFFKDYTVQHLTEGLIELNEAPSIAIFNSTVHVVWNTWSEEFDCKLYYIQSLDNGKTWSNRTEIGFANSTGIDSAIGVNDNIIHVAWKDSQSDKPEVYYSKSIDFGKTWSIPLRLTFNNSILTNIYDISIRVQGSDVYILWKDYRSGSSEVFIKYSSDDGDTWSEDKRLTMDYNPSYYPDFEVKDNNIFVAFENRGEFYNIGFLKSLDNGNTWSELDQITHTEELSGKPDLFYLDNMLYLVWQEEIYDYAEIFFTKSNDFGETWSQAQELTSNEIRSVNPKIYVYDDMVVVIWREQVDGKYLILSKISYDSGTTWTENQQLYSDNGIHGIELAGEASNVYIVWQNYYEGSWSDIMYMGNYNYTSAVISPVNQSTNPSEVDETPGYESVFLICMIVCVTVLYKIKRKRR